MGFGQKGSGSTDLQCKRKRIWFDKATGPLGILCVCVCVYSIKPYQHILLLLLLLNDLSLFFHPSCKQLLLITISRPRLVLCMPTFLGSIASLNPGSHRKHGSLSQPQTSVWVSCHQAPLLHIDSFLILMFILYINFGILNVFNDQIIFDVNSTFSFILCNKVNCFVKPVSVVCVHAL